MSVVDLEKYPYYLFVKMSKSKTYHDKCDCICKDTLIERLHILQIQILININAILWEE